MNTLNGYDFAVLFIYMGILIGTGVYFSRHIKGANDYFKAANKLTWWIAGLSSFMSAFSAWMFTGGAGIVYREGLAGMAVLSLTGLAIFSGYLVFAVKWRRSRVTTITEYLEERFNFTTHQLASWFYMPIYILYSATALFALAIFISTALHLNIQTVIWVSGLVIVAYTLLGGLWAVSVNDVVQFLVLLPICLLLVPLALMAVGGVDGLVAAAPQNYFQVPTEGLPGHYMLAYFVLLILGQNTNPIAQRYFSVRNEKDAKKVSLMCTLLFIVGIFIWAVPPMAARILYPDLSQVISLPNPDEGAFVVIALHLLPHGLIGLLVAAMFAASLSSLDSVYNLLAGVVSKDIIGKLFVKGMSDKAMLRVGQISTLFIGLVVIGLSLLMVRYGAGVFEIMMKISSLTVSPLAVPMLMGFLYRKAPPWSCMASLVCGTVAAAIFAFYPPVSEYLQAQGPWVEFTVSSFTIIFISLGAFIASQWVFRMKPAERERIDGFYRKLATPVDEATELEQTDLDKSSMAVLVGRIAMLIGFIVLLFVFIPGTMGDKLIDVMLASVLLGFGFLLNYFGGKKQASTAA